MFMLFAITSIMCEVYGVFTVRKFNTTWFNKEPVWVYAGGKSWLYKTFSVIEILFVIFLLITRYWYLGAGLIILGLLSFKWPRSLFFYYVNRLLSVLLLTAYIILA